MIGSNTTRHSVLITYTREELQDSRSSIVVVCTNAEDEAGESIDNAVDDNLVANET